MINYKGFQWLDDWRSIWCWWWQDKTICIMSLSLIPILEMALPFVFYH